MIVEMIYWYSKGCKIIKLQIGVNIMDELKTVIELLEKIRLQDKNCFDSCSEQKLLTDAEYSKLYQIFWQTDLRIGNVIDLLKTVNHK